MTDGAGRPKTKLVTDYERVVTSAPVNAQAARQMGRGEEWTPTVTLTDWYPHIPPIKTLDPSNKRNSQYIDFTGQTFGRLTVIGLMDKEGDGPASWVCRCQCGDYCTRRSKSLKVAQRGGNSFVPMCGRCEYQIKLREGWYPGKYPKGTIL